MFVAPSRCAVALAFLAPTSSMSAFVARLLDRVIMWSISSRSGDAGPDKTVSQAVGVVGRVERIGRPVHDRHKLIHQGNALIEPQGAGIHLPEQLDHHGHLHGAGGVKAFVGTEIEAVARLEVVKSHPDDRSGNLGDTAFDAPRRGVSAARSRAPRGRRE